MAGARWDLWGGLLGLSVSLLDLVAFDWVGLETERLASSAAGLMVLGSFVLGYGAVGFVSGRLWRARLRALADAKRISAQLEALEHSRAKLVQSEKLAALGRLAAGVAHEVRNPLGVIKASASMVREALDEASDDRRACALIVDEVDRLDGLIGALLAFAKPAQMTLTQAALKPLIERARMLATETRPSLKVSVEVPEALRVRADSDLLTQLVLGLLVNAAEAGAQRVELEARSGSGMVELAVIDDGPGISDADRARVFEPFFTTKDSGTGLGLSMAVRIAEAHGGSLQAWPSSRGAHFTITLPQDGPSVDQEAA